MIRRIIESSYDILIPNLTSSQQEFLKILAIVTMIASHIAVVLSLDTVSMFFAGRVAFPLFAFLMIYNYINHTSNTPKYILRLFVLAVISEPIYAATVGLDVDTVNILFTLTAGITIVYVLDYIINADTQLKKVAIGYFLLAFFLTAGLFVDYIYLGLILIIAYWGWLRFPSPNTLGIAILVTLMLNYPSGVLMMGGGLLSIVLIALSMHLSIKIKRVNKWFYYSFYPIHLILLYLVANQFQF